MRLIVVKCNDVTPGMMTTRQKKPIYDLPVSVHDSYKFTIG